MLGFEDDFGRAIKSCIKEGGSRSQGEVRGIFVVRRSSKEMEVCYQGGRKGRQGKDD